MENFRRTRRFLRRQRFWRHTSVVVALVVLFSGWVAWLAKGKVPLYVVSQQARLEVAALPVPVQAPVDGQVVFADVRLGRKVTKGDVLLKLDARSLELRRAELVVALHTGEASRDALRAELGAEEEVRDVARQLASRTSRAASARVALEEKTLAFKQKESEILERLREATAVSTLDALHSAEGAETQRALVLSTQAQASLDTGTSRMNLGDRDTRIASVRLTLSQAEAEVEKWKAQTDTLDYDIERRTVRAPADGELADVMSVSTGMMVTPDQRVATILPDDRIRVVAYFSPQEAIGRVRAGQPATLRLDNFPWAQFGTLRAVVDQVGREPRDGSVRVELSLHQANPAIPIEHGLTGLCEVEVDRTTPLRLLLRSVARFGVQDPGAPAPARDRSPAPVAEARPAGARDGT